MSIDVLRQKNCRMRITLYKYQIIIKIFWELLPKKDGILKDSSLRDEFKWSFELQILHSVLLRIYMGRVRT